MAWRTTAMVRSDSLVEITGEVDDRESAAATGLPTVIGAAGAGTRLMSPQYGHCTFSPAASFSISNGFSQLSQFMVINGSSPAYRWKGTINHR